MPKLVSFFIQNNCQNRITFSLNYYLQFLIISYMTKPLIYQTDYPYFITTNVINKYPLFCNKKYADILFNQIFFYQHKLNIDILCFCLMPTHLHIVIKQNEDITISKFMQQVKYRTAKHIKVPTPRTDSLAVSSGQGSNSKRCKNSIWQQSFYRRIINTDISLLNTITYIHFNWQKHHLPPKFSKPPYTHINQNLINKFL